MYADMEIDSEVFKAIRRFQKINKSRGLSEQDKHRLKEAYVKNYMEPEARRLLQQKLAEKKEQDERIRLTISR
jgi:hypothetical protein